MLPTILSQNVVGQATGILFCSGGVASLLNIPLSRLAVRVFEGDFFVPNSVYLGLVVLSTAAAFALGRSQKNL